MSSDANVQCFTRQVHEEPYAAWELYLCRAVGARNGHDGVAIVYLTSVGKNPAPLTVRRKSLDSGKEYVAIDGLGIYLLVDLDKSVRSFGNKAEYDAIRAEELPVRLVDKYNVEVDGYQFPLLPPQ